LPRFDVLEPLCCGEELREHLFAVLFILSKAEHKVIGDIQRKPQTDDWNIRSQAIPAERFIYLS